MDSEQLALTLVLRLERRQPPLEVDALEAAATAVLRLHALRERDVEGADSWTAWERAPRKLVRRARAGQWSAVVPYADVHVSRGTAEVVGFTPHRVDRTPAFLRRLQVGGTDLTEDDRRYSESLSGEPVLWLNPLLAMTTGKAMAQVGHGAAQLWNALTPQQRLRWEWSGFPLSVREASLERWDCLLDCGHVQVRDGGLTEIQPGTVTVIGEWKYAASAARPCQSISA